MRVGRLPVRGGDLRTDAIAQLRWAMAGAGLTVDKVALMSAVRDLPVVAEATSAAPSPSRPAAAYDAVVAAANDIGDGLHARMLRNALGIGYRGSGKNLTARREEFAAEHNAAVREAGGKNYVPDTTRAAYTVEQEMLGALVTALGAPPGARSTQPATAPLAWETVEYDVTYRLRGRAGVEAEVVHVVRALADGVDQLEVQYFCGSAHGGAARLELFEGGTLASDREVGRPGFRIARIVYPAPLRAGQQHRVRYDTKYPGSPKPDTWFTIAIGRAMERCEVRVSFDRTTLPSRVWQVDGVIIEAGGGDPDCAVALTPDATACVETAFPVPTPGLAYGIGWAWPD